MNRELITTTEHQAPPERVLLVPAPTPARTGPAFQRFASFRDLDSILEAASRSQYLAVDWETNGGDITAPSFSPVGLGLAWDTGSCYLNWTELYSLNRTRVLDTLLAHPCLLAHNAYFDGGVLRLLTGRHGNWHCTLALYMFLSNEGWAGQTWGLKDAQVQVLQWENSNEGELDEWLVTNGYYKGGRCADDTVARRHALFQEGKLKPDKSMMHLAPPSILGKYCILDAEACYLLYTKHLLPVSEQFGEDFHDFTVMFMHLIKLHIEQKLWGLQVDLEALNNRRTILAQEIIDRDRGLLTHPLLVDHIAAIESGLRKELEAREPARYLKQKERPPEPPRYRKDGKESKTWLNWVANGDKYLVPVVSQNWLNWQERWTRAINGDDPAYRFNLQSGDQLRTLLYSRMGYPVRVETESGLPGTGVKALKGMGEVGKLFIERAWCEKEMSYLVDYAERAVDTATIHPSFRLPGTKTGRLSSKSPNLQQVPKTKAVMNCFTARPGNVLVDLDFSALEPVVATEFSGDRNMALIYGDGRPANDIYLFVGASIPGMKEKILAAGYHPERPTKEGLARAKKECKHERSICKTVVLACQYGAGVDKVMSTLEQDDVFLPREEVATIHRGYWDLFPDLKNFGRKLGREWERNRGWILNGMGRPMCLTEDYRHDVLNRFVQSTGHDILVRYVWILSQKLNLKGINWKPWVIDWHDAAAVEVPEGSLEETVECYRDALALLNRELGGTITLKGTPSWGRTMADIKEPEE